MSGPFLNTRGNSVLGIGICARCSNKFPLLELQPDRNSPGLLVCEADNDEFDPYRLPPRQPDNIVLPFNRPDLPLDVPSRNCTHYILASQTPQGLQADGQPGWNPQPGLQVDSVLGSQLCDRQSGIYGGRILAMAFGLEITDPGVEIVLTWPLDVGFEVDHYEVYAYYDVDNPTAADLELIATLGPSVSGYTDTHGYTNNFGYTVVAIGVNGEQAYAPGVTYTVPVDATPPVGPLALDSRMTAQNSLSDLVLNTIAPDYLLDTVNSTDFAPSGFLTAYRDMLCWLNTQLTWTLGYGASPDVYYINDDGTGPGAATAGTFGGFPFYPTSIRPELGTGATPNRKWLGGAIDVAAQPRPVFGFMDGVSDPSANLLEVPGYGAYDATVVDCWSWDGGDNVFLLIARFDAGTANNPTSDIVQYVTGIATFYTRDSWTNGSAGAGGAMAIFSDGQTICASTVQGIQNSLSHGVSFSHYTSPLAGGTPTSSPRIAAGVIQGIEVFVTVMAESNQVAYSEDGADWTVVSVPSEYQLIDVVIGNNLAAFVGWNSDTGNNGIIAAMRTLGTIELANPNTSEFAAISIAIQQTN